MTLTTRCEIPLEMHPRFDICEFSLSTLEIHGDLCTHFHRSILRYSTRCPLFYEFQVNLISKLSCVQLVNKNVIISSLQSITKEVLNSVCYLVRNDW